ncbi:MAG: MFS transporter [Halobacteriota archaeon]
MRFDKLSPNGSIFGADGRGLILATLSVGWFFTSGVRLIFPVVLPQIRTAFEINNAAAGFIFSVILLMIAVGQFPSGIMADRIGERSILTASVVGAMLGVFVVATAPVFVVFLAGCVLFGIGAGLYQPPTLSALSKVFPGRSGTAHGIIFATGSIGTIVLPVLAGFAVVEYGWRISFTVMVPVFVLTAIGVWLLVPAADRDESEQPTPFLSVARSGFTSVLNREILFVAGAMVMVVLVFQAVSTFLPTYLIEVKGLDQQVATTVFGLFFAGSFVFQVGAGMLADRWSQRHLLLAISSLCAVAVYGLTLVSGLLPIVALSVTLGSASAYISVANTYFVSTLPDEVQSAGVGLLRSMVIGIGSSSPIFIGFLADIGRFDWAFQILTVLLLAAAGVLTYSLVAVRGQKVPSNS